jgi:GNAT superfamily N-acetyltransferase
MVNPIFTMAQETGLVRRRPLEDGQVSTSCVYVDLGPAQMITLPGELLPRLGFELKAALPGPCRLLIGLADDELGYILPDDEFVAPADYMNPGAQYEESMSMGPRTGSLVLAAAKGLIGSREPRTENREPRTGYPLGKPEGEPLVEMMITVRPANVPQDYAAISAVLKSDWPGAATAEVLAYEDATRDPGEYHATLVAEVTDGDQLLLVGVADIGHDELAHREGRFEIDLRVHLDWQGRGVGKALYQAVMDHLAALAAQEVTTMAWQTHPRSPRFLAERGFVEAWQRVDSYLDVADFDWAPYAGLAERLRALGIEIATYAELAGDPDRLAKLYELDWTLWEDVPYGQAVTRRSLEQFAAEVNHPRFLPDACFIAVKDGEFVGYSNLITAEAGFDIDMTGVARAYRGKGVATLLKLRGIRYAQEHGNRRLWVVNDSVNAAMLGLNKKLGYAREGANIRFVKKLVTD